MYYLQSFYGIYTKTVNYLDIHLLLIDYFYKNPMYFSAIFDSLDRFCISDQIPFEQSFPA